MISSCSNAGSFSDVASYTVDTLNYQYFNNLLHEF